MNSTRQDALTTVGGYLATFPLEDSFAWSPDRLTRRSFWLACHPGSSEIITDPRQASRTDGDPLAGLRGLRALDSGDPDLTDAIRSLLAEAHSALISSALALGVDPDFIPLMTMRTRFVSYSGPHPGIGTHFDGNFLSAVITNRYGLVSLGYDGSVTWVSPRGVSVMPGSSAHRLARLTTTEVLPTFHLVAASPQQQPPKVSVAAFLNLPDHAVIPPNQFRDNAAFYHDVNAIKNDDGPGGTLARLWQRQAEALGITVDQLVNGRIPGLGARP